MLPGLWGVATTTPWTLWPADQKAPSIAWSCLLICGLKFSEKLVGVCHCHARDGLADKITREAENVAAEPGQSR